MKIALCLSGGGLRASLFHLGVLKRLHELDLLRWVNVVSAVSGGAVTAALFQHHLSRDESCPRKPGIAYDWKAFEDQVLRVAKTGLLGEYMKSVMIYLYLGAAIIFLLVGLWLDDWSAERSPIWSNPAFVLASLSAFATGASYASQVPFACRNARAIAERIKDETRLGVTGPSYYAYKHPVLLGLMQALSPGAMRVATLEANLFEHRDLGSLPEHPRMFLAAVELNRGREMVFSPWVLATLDPVGTSALWEQRPDLGEATTFNRWKYGYPFRSSYNVSNLSVADAVAASSAYPPFFRPIAIYEAYGQFPFVGHFSDGGLLDNAGLNVPLALLEHIAAHRQRYQAMGPLETPGTDNGFTSRITDIFIANAGAPMVNAPRHQWTPLAFARRIIDIVFGGQESNLLTSVELIERSSKLRVTAIVHWMGFAAEHPFCDSPIADLIGRIRTHFDSFDPIETAALVYAGYYWTDQGLAERSESSEPCKSFAQIADSVTGSDKIGKLSVGQLCRHLRFSHRRSSSLRTLGRLRASVRSYLSQYGLATETSLT